VLHSSYSLALPHLRRGVSQQIRCMCCTGYFYFRRAALLPCTCSDCSCSCSSIVIVVIIVMSVAMVAPAMHHDQAGSVWLIRKAYSTSDAAATGLWKSSTFLWRPTEHLRRVHYVTVRAFHKTQGATCRLQVMSR
jgi:hypothetical protein